MSIIDKVISEGVPHWTCPDCGTLYFGAVGTPKFCPACRAEKDKLEQKYWDSKRATLRLVSDDIVARILAGGGHES